MAEAICLLLRVEVNSNSFDARPKQSKFRIELSSVEFLAGFNEGSAEAEAFVWIFSAVGPNLRIRLGATYGGFKA